MSDDDPKFMKPGDDPQLDHALNELRFDSGLYEAGDYDMFGRRRAGKKDGEGAPTAEAAAGPVAKPSAPRSAAPVVAERPRRIKPLVAVGAVLAAFVPVLVYSAVWKPQGVPEAAATVKATAAKRPATAAPPASTPLIAVPPPPVVPSAAPSAPTASSSAIPAAPVPAPSAVPAPTGAMHKPKARGVVDPYDAPVAPLPVVTAAPPAPIPAVTAVPSTTAPAATSSAHPPEPPPKFVQ